MGCWKRLFFSPAGRILSGTHPLDPCVDPLPRIMPDPSHLPRLYADKEMSQLLKRATELQHEEGVTGPQPGGLSLRELEEVAAEAGIDPCYLRRAAAELESGGREAEGWEKLTGERLTLVRELVVPGELPTEEFERVLAVIQSTTAEHGRPSLMGRTFMWQGENASKSRTVVVTVTVRRGETHIRAEERLHQLAAGLFWGSAGGGTGVGVGVGVPVAINVLGSALLAVALPLAVVGVTYTTARLIYRGIVKRRTAALARLVDALAREATEAVASAAARPSLAHADRPMELPRS